METKYMIELANTAKGHNRIGNFYGVGKFVNGCRHGWALEPQPSRERAAAFAEHMNAQQNPSREPF